MSGPLVGKVLEEARTRHPEARLVACVIAERTRKDQAAVQMSVAEIARKAGVSTRYVPILLAKLEQNDDLTIERVDGAMSWYTLHPGGHPDQASASMSGEPLNPDSPLPLNPGSVPPEPQFGGPLNPSSDTPDRISGTAPRERIDASDAGGQAPPHPPDVDWGTVKLSKVGKGELHGLRRRAAKDRGNPEADAAYRRITDEIQRRVKVAAE